ncbi:MAG TPA: DMT family transporter [Thermoanaerobaculia bacterium]|nr:DMT family transporter [Thermoanaerobaculia bacterium]
MSPSRGVIHLALFTVNFLFAVNYVVSKLGMSSFDPFTFAYLRVLGAAIVMNALIRGAAPLSRADFKRVALYSLLGVVINQSMFLAGLALTSAHVAAILITAVPVFTLGAAMVFGEEHVTAMKIAGIALAAAGALTVVGGEGFGGATKSLLGDLLIIGNSLAYALFLVLSKRDMARLSPLRVVARMFAIAAVVMLPIAAVPMLRLNWRAIPPGAWLSLAFVIAGPTIAAYLLNAWALAHTDSSLVAAYTYLQPVMTVMLAAMFLGEQIRAVAIVAGVMIFAGVWLAGRAARIA